MEVDNSKKRKHKQHFEYRCFKCGVSMRAESAFKLGCEEKDCGLVKLPTTKEEIRFTLELLYQEIAALKAMNELLNDQLKGFTDLSQKLEDF